MKSFAIVTLLSLSASAMAQAPAAKPWVIQSPEAYDTANLPDDAYGKMVKYGKELSERTFAYIGPEVKNAKMRYAGNNLSCTSCHEAAGTKPFAIPWVGAHASFPQYRGRENEVSTLEERVNGCMERSMAGKALPLDSREMKAFVTYMHFLSKDVPVSAKIQGQGVPAFKAPERKADIVAGGKVYVEKCASCHGANGAGVRNGPVGSATGHAFPPLWGNDTFNNGAGMNRLLTASSFIKTNMPLGTVHGQPQLSDDEAYDVAAFVLSKPRKVKANLERDFPARWNKPVEAAFGPYVTGMSAEQHKYGPFGPLQDRMKELKDELMKTKSE